MTESWSLILDIIIAVAAALSLGIVFELIGFSAIIGYLLAGIIVGSSGLSLIADKASIHVLAELGIVLLMFSIGLEFSVQKLKSFGRERFLTGGLQILICSFFCSFILATVTSLSLQACILIGLSFCLSSTALVLGVLSSTAQLESEKGRSTVSLLLVQDIAIIPILLFVDFLVPTSGSFLSEFGAKLISIVGVLFVFAILYVINKKIFPYIFSKLPVNKNPDIPIMLSLILCFSSAWLAHEFGVEASLGAFCAGLFLGGSQFSEQIRSDVNPFKVIFVTIFFTSIGLVIDLSWIINNFGLILLLTILVIVLKFLFVYIVVNKVSKKTGKKSFIIALMISQIGEFSFILANIGKNKLIIDEFIFQCIVNVATLSLILTPVLIYFSEAIANKLENFLVRIRVWQDDSEVINKFDLTGGLSNHNILIGYGPAGKQVLDFHEAQKENFFILENNPKTVNLLRKKGYRAEQGDASRKMILVHAGVARANSVIVSIPDTGTTSTIIKQARSINPDIKILVRARLDSVAKSFEAQGADFVLMEESEAGLILAKKLTSIFD